MKWFQIKEQSAGEKRLFLSYYLYKIFGKKILYIIAFLVSFFTFIFASKVREYSKKYFVAVYDDIKVKPNLFNQFKHILSYAYSLVDKLLVCCGDYSFNNIEFADKEIEKELQNDIENKKGVFLICNHIGNIEVFQSFFIKYKNKNQKINVFMSQAQSQIFNGFLNKIGISYPIRFFPVESLGISTGVELKENLNNGEMVFIAGDRLSQNNDINNIKTTMFSKNILLPKGTFKLAKLMEVPTYFISAVKVKNKYKIIIERQSDLSEKALISSFTKYMERVIKINPFQFFHFYDFFIQIS